jgi:acetyl-CoA/propionyl-CoA carboxylase biotin carboxyl carrier protein
VFDAVLVANRGEIALRIMRTLRRLAITAVAVYSDVDGDAPHVRAADMAVRLGPGPARDSYLHIERVIAAAQRAGVQAVHPGYGFLAENPDFAAACARAGLVLVGPPAEVIATMADKARARRLMRSAGVPVVPGTDTGELDDDALVAAAHTMGPPLMVKPVAGGGGKGMVVVEDLDELPLALQAARRQARAAFADDRLLLERLVTRPRHIEVQVLADGRGAVVALGERECSLQRRHQKIVEEAPSPLLDAPTRARIGASAVEAARACGYRGAGTVEFIVSDAAPSTFFFLEMNTRLQVEHPVTEMVTGLDLVEWQVRIAAGAPLSFTQAEVTTSGHAVEARVYAEDPARDFLPTGGTVILACEPGGAGVRVDSGVTTGTVVPTLYDPLLAKVIAHGADRRQALGRLEHALRDMTLLGVQTNAGFLQRLLSDDDVRAGALDTGLVARRVDDLAACPVPDHVLVAAALGHLEARERTDVRNAFDLTGGWRLGEPAWTALRLRAGERTATVRTRGRLDAADVTVDDGAVLPARALSDGTALSVDLDGVRRRYRLAERGAVIWVAYRGVAWALHREERLEAARHTATGGGPVVSPLPGTVVTVEVDPGVAVSAGEVLAVVEAMKMEHQVIAPSDGVVTDVAVRPGDQVTIDQTLLVVEAAQPPDAGVPHSEG